jgi:hypothetical protein
MDWGIIECEPEIGDWLKSLDEDAVNRVAFYLDLLAERGPLHGEPYTRQLDGKLADRPTRISYWIAPGRRIILLTTWTKTTMRETAEVERARRAMRRCQDARHTVDEEEW